MFAFAYFKNRTKCVKHAYARLGNVEVQMDTKSVTSKTLQNAD